MERRTKTPRRTRKQSQRRLLDEDQQKMVAAYRDGASQRRLAREFGVHRTTVTAILERSGLPTRPIRTAPELVAKMPELYAQGLSSAAIGELLGVDAKTVVRYLSEAGVTVRPRRGWSY